MPRCTMPYMPWFRVWFNTKFGDLCERHDLHYQQKYPRKMADIELAVGIINRGYPLFGFLAYFAVRIFGRWHY